MAVIKKGIGKKLSKEMLISSDRNETRVAIMESKKVTHLYFDRKHGRSIVGNIYLGKVKNVLPSLDAAFVDIGEDKNAFLYKNEVAYDVGIEDREEIPHKIQHILKKNQMILVQVTKDPMKGKGARLTTFISIPGRYLVLAPFNNGIGVSRKLKKDEREELRRLAEEIRCESGVIVRTAAREVNSVILKKDLRQLMKIWKTVKKKESVLSAPGLIHEECSIVVKLLRDIFTEDFSTIYVNKKGIKRDIATYLNGIGVKFNNIIVHHGKKDLFEEFSINEAVESALERKIWLKSGGFIVIDYGEALTSIDVNTGKYTSGKSPAVTIFRTNLESAEVIAEQLRLRDIGGIIVIDFIDMESEGDRLKILKRFKQCLEEDKTKTEVLSFSKLGLVEMTRKNVSDGILGTMCKVCPGCDGSGYVKSEESVMLEIERNIRELTKERREAAFLIKLNYSIASMIIGHRGRNLKHLRMTTKKYIIIKGDKDIPMDSFTIVAGGSVGEIQKASDNLN